jgi:phage gp29-like protein
MALVDAAGNPIDLAALREPQTARVGHLQREFEGHPARGLTPTRLAQLMTAAEQGDLVGQIDLADDMEERDTHLYSELGKRRGAVYSLAWSVEAPDNATPAEKRITEQVREWLAALVVQDNGVTGGMDLLINLMTDGILKGFAPLEMVWGLEQRVLLPRLTLQPQRWFTSAPDRRRLLLRSQTTQVPATEYLPAVMGEELQPWSWLLHMHPARNGYVPRTSLARVLFWPYLFKNYSVRDLAEFLEIYGLPLRLGKYPAGASDEEKRRLLQAVVQIGHNAAGIIPQSMALEFQAAAAGTEVPFTAMWDRMDAAESKAILGQTLSAQQGQTGSLALGKVHERVRMDIRDADVRLVEGSVTRQLLAPLVLLNIPGADPRRLPHFKMDIGDAEDLELYAEGLPKLAAAGLRIPVKWAQEKLRIPEPMAGEAVMTGPAPTGFGAGGQAAPAVAPGAAPPPAAEPPADALAALLRQVLAGRAAAAPERDLIDDLVGAAADDWRPVMAPLVQPLLTALDDALARGVTLHEFRQQLPGLLQSMDGGVLAERLARGAFFARLIGEADLDLQGNEA